MMGDALSRASTRAIELADLVGVVQGDMVRIVKNRHAIDGINVSLQRGFEVGLDQWQRMTRSRPLRVLVLFEAEP